MKWTVLFGSMAVLTTVIVAQALAQSRSDITPQASALEQVLRERNGTDDSNDPKWRASLATALHRYCDNVMAQVPRNTPEEDRWVDREFADVHATPSPPPSLSQKEWDERMARDNARLLRLLSSIENVRKELRDLLGNCSTLTTTLIELKTKTPAPEALLWAQLMQIFMADDYVWEAAETVGLVSPKRCKRLTPRQILAFPAPAAPPGHDENDICTLWSYVGNMITLGAVLPLLKENAKR
jgi:hypothetical protein